MRTVPRTGAMDRTFGRRRPTRRRGLTKGGENNPCGATALAQGATSIAEDTVDGGMDPGFAWPARVA